MAEPDYKSILLQLIASLTLADHMGDAAEDIGCALKQAGVDVEWDDLSDLGRKLGKMGVTTLYGTKLGEEDEDDDEA